MKEPARQRARKKVQNSNKKRNTDEACLTITILACLGKTKDITVAEHNDKSESVIGQGRWVGRHQLVPCLAGQGEAFALPLGAMGRVRGCKQDWFGHVYVSKIS